MTVLRFLLIVDDGETEKRVDTVLTAVDNMLGVLCKWNCAEKRSIDSGEQEVI